MQCEQPELGHVTRTAHQRVLHDMLVGVKQGRVCLPIGVFLCQHIEEKGVDIIVQGLVVQKQLGQQAKALAIHLQHAWVRQSSSTK